MSKRFADTDKYKKQFIRNLPAAYKILWEYICLDCDHAGIWHADFEVAQMRVGKDAPIEKEEALKYFNLGEERIIVLNGGSKWFIQPFVDFQYGKLDPHNRVHASVISLLLKEGIKGLASPLQGAKDKDKDKDKEEKRGLHKDIDFNITNAWHDNHTKGGKCAFCGKALKGLNICHCDPYQEAFHAYKEKITK